MKPRPDFCPVCGGSDIRLDYENGKPRRYRCRTCMARQIKARRHRSPHKSMFFAAKHRARNAGVPFELTTDDVRRIIADWTCSYCETQVGSFEGNTRPTSATLDRLIPSEGYTCSNTVLACHRCNAAKAEHTPTTLRAWAERIEAVIHRQNPNEAA